MTAHTDWVTALVFLQDYELMASSSKNGKIIIWNTTNWTISQVLTEHTLMVNRLSKLSNENLVSVSNDYKIKIWDLKSDDSSMTLNTGGAINSLAILTDEIIITGGTSDGLIKIWNITNTSLENTLQGHTGIVNSLLLLDNGNLASGGYGDFSVRVWNITSLKSKFIL